MDKNNLLADTFKWLFIGLLVCFGVAYFTTTPDIAVKIYGDEFNNGYYIIFIILELVCAIGLSFFIRKMSKTLATLFYLLYAGLTGLTLSGIFLVYTTQSIAFVFLATSLVFGIFAVIGKTTKVDLSKFGIYLFVALIAIIIMEIINIFVYSSTLNMMLIILTILIFCGYVAYDVNMLLRSTYLDETENKSIYFAFQLFLDFINLFIELLKLFGKERDQ